MFELSHAQVVNWVFYTGLTNVLVPGSIDLHCGHCRRSVNFAFGSWRINPDSTHAEGRCSGCGQITRFWVINWPHDQEQSTIDQARVFCDPPPPYLPELRDDIAQLSPMFVEIYNQAAEAEARGLHHINGMGYRKALEFLIKDYVTRQNPNDAQSIQALPLSKCINKYVMDQRIQDCATMAVWLGNDETHYVRRWDDRDINDLKILLDLTLHWISMELITQHYKASMLQQSQQSPP